MARAFSTWTLITAALMAVASPSYADDPSSFFEQGKAKVNNILDMFSSRWIDSAGRGADEKKEPAEGDVQPDPKKKDGPPEGAPDPGPPPRSGRARTTPLWMPYCFLVDANEDPTTVNKNMKKIVDEYGRCGIAVEAFSFTIQPGYPNDSTQLNNLVRQACNFDEAFGVRGSIQMSVNNAQIPQQMCPEEPNAQGCSTLCERLSVSYLAPGAGAQTAVHESLHGNCCGRLCVNEGQGLEGIGYGIDLVDNHTPVKWTQAEPAQKPELAEAKEEEDELGDAACTSLRQGASPNDGTHRWDPNKLSFYARAKDPSAQKALDGRSLFTAKSGKTPDSNHPAGGGKDGGEAGKRLGSVSYDDNAKKGANNQDGVPQKPEASSNDPRHKNGAGVGVDPMVQALLKNLKDAEDPLGDPDQIQFTNPARSIPSSSGGSGSKRVSFDDNAKKGPSRTGGGTNQGTGSAAQGSISGVGEAGGLSGLTGIGGGGFGADSAGGGEGGTSINGADGSGSTALDGNFFDSKPQQSDEEGERPRGSTLRPRDLSAIKRESASGLSQRTDVLTSVRPDPNRIAGEQKATTGY